MSVNEINVRYSELSESSCCLSCGGAINYAKPATGAICVDLGSGRGNDVIRLAESVGEFGHVYGIDISDGMIAKARLNLSKFEVTNATIIKSGLEKLPLKSKSVDVVISNCTINHSSDKQQVWNEIYRILKEEGRFVVSDIYATETIPDQFRNDPAAVAECWAGAVTKSEYLQMLKAAGFQEVVIHEESQSYPKGQVEVVSFTIEAQKPVDYSCL